MGLNIDKEVAQMQRMTVSELQAEVRRGMWRSSRAAATSSG